MKTKLFLFILLFVFSLNTNAQKKVWLNKSEKLLKGKEWVLDTLQYHKINNVKITNEITYLFERDSNQKDKLAYSKKTDDGIFADNIFGFWSVENKTLILRQWDYDLGEGLDPEYFEIKKLNKTTLLIKNKNGTFFPFFNEMK